MTDDTHTYNWLIDWVVVLCPNRHKIGHFGDGNGVGLFSKKKIKKDKVRKKWEKRISGEAYNTDKLTIYIAQKSKTESKGYYAWGHTHIIIIISSSSSSESLYLSLRPSGPMVPTNNPGHSLSEMPTSIALLTSHHFLPSFSPVVSFSLGILHEWMRTQTLAKPSSNLLQRTGGDHRGSRSQLGWRTFMMTCLHWILGYMRLEIWRKIGLSGDWCLCTALHTRGACYALIVVHATIGLDWIETKLFDF